MQEIALTLGLRDWVHAFKQPRWQSYCETVDDARRVIRRHQPPNEAAEPAPDQVVPTIAQALDSEGALLAHTFKAATCKIGRDASWDEIIEAGAWQVLLRYEVAVQKGDWPRQ